MLSDWTVECGHDDPVLVVPWSDPDKPSSHFIDLRENPYDLDWLEEATQHPALLHALRALNAPRSPVFTAKCDVWKLPEEELDALRLELDLIPEDTSVGTASYIDLIWRERSVFVSFHQHEQILHRIQRLASPRLHTFAALESVHRRRRAADRRGYGALGQEAAKVCRRGDASRWMRCRICSC